MLQSRNGTPAKNRTPFSDKEWACLTLMTIVVAGITCATCLVVYAIISMIFDF